MHTRRFSRSLLSLTISSVLMVAAAPALSDTTINQARQYQLPAASLSETLMEFSDRAGISIQFNPEQLEALNSPGLQGEYRPGEGLNQLLKQSGFQAVEHSPGHFVIRKQASGAQTQTPTQASPDVVVIGHSDNLNRQGQLGVLGNMRAGDAPFSVSTMDQQQIADQQALTIADVVLHDPSVRTAHVSGGMLDSYTLRGFPLNEGNFGEIAFNGMYGIAPNYRVIADYVEQVEVIKGPVAMLSGMSPNNGLGGSINIVPKKPLDEAFNQFTARFSSDSQIGGHLDVSRRLGDEERFGIRFNGSLNHGDTSRDNQSRESGVLAVAADYRGDRFRGELNVVRQNEKLDAPLRHMWLESGVAVPDAPDGARNITQSWEWSDVEDQAIFLKGEYDLTDNLTFYAQGGRSDTRVNRLFGYPYIQNNAGDSESKWLGLGRFDVERTVLAAGVKAGFNLGSTAHQMTFQMDRYDDQLKKKSVTTGENVLSNIYNPVNRPAQSVPEGIGEVPRTSENELTGISLADQIRFWDGKAHLIVGLRHQSIDSVNFNKRTGAVSGEYDKSVTTPLLAVAVQPWSGVTLYANRSEGLSKGGTAPASADNAGEVLKPYVSEQFEAGVKFEGQKVAATISAFQITRPDGLLVNNVYTADGEQRNRGLELTLEGELYSGLKLRSGMMLLDAEIVKAADSEREGKEPIGVPSVQANLGAQWRVPGISGLKLTGDLVYTGEQYVDGDNAQKIPDWTRIDAGVSYQTQLGERDMVFRASVQNLTDEKYWSGVDSWSGLAHGAPRTFVLSSSINF